MPFAYYGAKHKLARYYPRPVFDHIIEPFAGSAGYACYWAPRLGPQTRVTLYDKAPEIVDLWHRIQQFDRGEAIAIVEAEIQRKRTAEPLVYLSGGSSAMAALRSGTDRAVTPRMVADAPNVARRIDRLLDTIKNWTVKVGSYHDIPDSEATWHIDPPYQPIISVGGIPYLESGIDYAELGEWCQTRSGQVMVCEQHPAAWLPFKPHRQQINSVSTAMRTEVLWHRSPIPTDLLASAGVVTNTGDIAAMENDDG